MADSEFTKEELEKMTTDAYARTQVLENMYLVLIQYLCDDAMEKYDKQIAMRKVMKIIPNLKAGEFEEIYKDFRKRIGQPETEEELKNIPSANADSNTNYEDDEEEDDSDGAYF